MNIDLQKFKRLILDALFGLISVNGQKRIGALLYQTKTTCRNSEAQCHAGLGHERVVQIGQQLPTHQIVVCGPAFANFKIEHA